jgi:hypothetical protein
LAHRLFPIIAGEYLQPAEIVRRLQAEFDFIDADVDGGTDVILGMIEQFKRMKVPQTVIDEHREMLGKAIRIVVSDREDCGDEYVTFTAMPATGLLIGYHSGQHEDAAAPLLKRVCSALGYYPKLI